MHQENAARWIEVGLALRVFGPDVFRLLRRMLAAGVRIGISGLAGGPRHSGPAKPSCKHGGRCG
ncbi:MULTISPECIES: hypothetical protein [Streptomyces]|uniref:hypothetical protein n=1 Tax=Streptomyces TaxID=1883 RepID=UPI00163C9301|nr:MULTISPECIES: hypothetical protein [Streptomyces]MBC2874508.1 hypothetical protein [Streptomyces sp. TYQ1024]UBI36719.1 hypothetical protein K7I03_09755 [Streptomyces mobaraensis]UKW29311.1 hypothetical protein MCU78_09730 [Streptomyces sp. TYQ1024]